MSEAFGRIHIGGDCILPFTKISTCENDSCENSIHNVEPNRVNPILFIVYQKSALTPYALRRLNQTNKETENRTTLYAPTDLSVTESQKKKRVKRARY